MGKNALGMLCEVSNQWRRYESAEMWCSGVLENVGSMKKCILERKKKKENKRRGRGS